MKKVIALILALTMVFALVACGKTEAPAETPAETPAAAPATASRRIEAHTSLIFKSFGSGTSISAISEIVIFTP